MTTRYLDRQTAVELLREVIATGDASRTLELAALMANLEYSKPVGSFVAIAQLIDQTYADMVRGNMLGQGDGAVRAIWRLHRESWAHLLGHPLETDMERAGMRIHLGDIARALLVLESEVDVHGHLLGTSRNTKPSNHGTKK